MLNLALVVVVLGSTLLKIPTDLEHFKINRTQ